VKSEPIKELITQSLSIDHNNYAILLYEMNRFQEAEDHYKSASKINPEYADAHYNMLSFFTRSLDFKNSGGCENRSLHYRAKLS